jgi:acetoin utilization deacetylase AcuC-like enzyme
LARATRAGATINVPLPAAGDGAAYAAAFERVVLPLLDASRSPTSCSSPRLRRATPATRSRTCSRDGDYAWMAARLREARGTAGGGRVGLFLEGGYDLHALEFGVENALRGLVGAVPDDVMPRGEDPSAAFALQAVLKAQRPYWPSLR